MRKTGIITGVVAMAVAAVSLTACGSSASEFAGTGTSSVEVPAKDYNGFFKHTADVYKDYVTLADYKNLEIEEIDRSNEEISDEAVETEIQALETEYTEQEDVTEGGTTQDGDIITLDYSGSIDGVAFDGGTATDQTYTVGSQRYITDLDEGLKGKKANTEYDIPAKFPDDYSSEELKGKDSVFKVTITNIIRPSVPTIDDAWVNAHSSELESKGYGKVTTLAALKEGIKASLKEEAVESNKSKIISAALEKLKENSTIKGYPEDEVAERESVIRDNIDSQFSQYQEYMDLISSSMTVETEDGETTESTEATTTTVDEDEQFLEYIQQYYGLTSEEEYDDYVKESAEGYVGEKMIVTLIGADQGFTASVDEIVKLGEEFAAANGYDSYQSFIDLNGSRINCYTGFQTIYSKVADYIVGAVKMVPAATTEATTETDEMTTAETTETETATTQN